MSYQEHLAADRRLVILRLLEEGGDYTANEYLLGEALPGFGHAVSQRQLREDLAWLGAAQLITTEESGGMLIARVTRRGLDVARGLELVEGVKRPGPED